MSPKSKLACPDPPYLCTCAFRGGSGKCRIHRLNNQSREHGRRLGHNLLVWTGSCCLFLETFHFSTLVVEFHTCISTIPHSYKIILYNTEFLKFHDNVKHNHNHTHIVKLTIKNNYYVVHRTETQEEKVSSSGVAAPLKQISSQPIIVAPHEQSCKHDEGIPVHDSHLSAHWLSKAF